MKLRSGRNRLLVEGSVDFQRWALVQFVGALQMVADAQAIELEARATALRATAYAEARRLERLGRKQYLKAMAAEAKAIADEFAARRAAFDAAVSHGTSGEPTPQ